MNASDLFDKVVEARLRHALLLEEHMIRLVKRKDLDAEGWRKEYEWYANAAKALATKDLLGLSKLFGEVEDEFVGFDQD